MTGDKVGVVDQVRRVNGVLAETEMRNGDGAGLLGVIDKVGLGIIVGGFADDFNGVLVGANGAVRTKAVEHGFVGATHGGAEGGVVLKARTSDVFVDTDDKVFLRLGFAQVVKDRLGHGRGKFLGAKTIAAADDNRIAVQLAAAVGHRFADGGANIHIKRLAQ